MAFKTRTRKKPRTKARHIKLGTKLIGGKRRKSAWGTLAKVAGGVVGVVAGSVLLSRPKASAAPVAPRPAGAPVKR